MTDASDLPGQAPPAAGADAGPAVSAPQTPVLARGHLHPAILLLRLYDAMRQALFPALLGLFDRWFLVLAIVLFVVQLGYALARYLTLEYTLTADELRVREGLLERQERRIPLDRIQDLAFESTILRRLLGLSVVLVETASGTGAEARLDALSKAQAEHLREVLLAARSNRPVAPTASAEGGAAPAAAVPPPSEPEWVVHRTTAGQLLLRGITDLRLSAFFVTGFAALELADQFDVAVRLQGVARGFRDWLSQFSPAMLALLLLALLGAVISFGVVAATIGNLVTFHGFVLTLRGDVLQRRFGLLTTRAKTLPRARIQRASIEQTWLRRLLGVAVVKADSAGGSRGQGEDSAGGFDVVVPLCQVSEADRLLPALLPGIEGAVFGWQRGSPRLVLRMTVQGALLAAVVLPLAWAGVGPWSLLALGIVPVWALLGVLVYHNLGFARGGTFVALRHGIVGRHLAYLPTAKVQAIVVRQGPIGILLGLADLTVFVAGGSPTRIPDLLIRDARSLALGLAADAAAAAAADW